jgi:hypothetical protein
MPAPTARVDPHASAAPAESTVIERLALALLLCSTPATLGALQRPEFTDELLRRWFREQAGLDSIVVALPEDPGVQRWRRTVSWT